MATISLNCGKIKSNKIFSDDAKGIIKDVLGKTGFAISDPVTIIFHDFFDGNFKDTAEGLIERLAPLGYVLDGSVTNDGGFGNGRTDITNNIVTFLTAKEAAIDDAADNVLINVLKKRGYSVSKGSGMTLERAVELLNSVVNHITVANNTMESIGELMSMGFGPEDLMFLGFTKEDIGNWEDEQND